LHAHLSFYTGIIGKSGLSRFVPMIWFWRFLLFGSEYTVLFLI
jgi:hypothetical protein